MYLTENNMKVGMILGIDNEPKYRTKIISIKNKILTHKVISIGELGIVGRESSGRVNSFIPLRIIYSGIKNKPKEVL